MQDLPAEFLTLLRRKERKVIDLFEDARAFLLELHPTSNELLYHTHALTSVLSVSDRLADAYCMLPIYTKHVNLGFNRGTLLPDPERLLKGTGKWIRHVPIATPADYRNPAVAALVRAAADYARRDQDRPSGCVGQIISKLGR
jgi:hypothetical protein